LKTGSIVKNNLLDVEDFVEEIKAFLKSIESKVKHENIVDYERAKATLSA